MNWIFSITLVGGIILYVIFRDLFIKRRVMEKMKERPALTPKEFGRRYFSPDKAVIATKLRVIFSEVLRLDLSRMSADDDLGHDLKIGELDSLADLEMVIAVEKEFGIKIENKDAEAMRTLRDVVDYVANKLAEKQADQTDAAKQ